MNREINPDFDTTNPDANLDVIDLDIANPDLAHPDLDVAINPDLVVAGPPSCAAGLICNNVNCCESLLVPGGSFFRSYDNTAEYHDRSYPATISSFRLDRFETTVGRFRQFVQAVREGWRPAAWPWPLAQDLAEGLRCNNDDTWTDTLSNESLPINCVTWFEALAFCIWDGGRLPTEAEWNYAAAGGGEQRAYPWSAPPSATTIDASKAVYAPTSPQPVGSRPAGRGRWGHDDLAGNLWEWTMDGYAAYQNPCSNCAGNGPLRVIRGGGKNPPEYLRTSLRYNRDPAIRGDGVGFRCTRD